MNKEILREIPYKALAKTITFPQILATLAQEGVESYHVDFIRNEYRYYGRDGETFVTDVPLVHDEVAPDFCTERLEHINQKVQAGNAWYPDFVKEGAAAGCAYYIVYLGGRKVRYFGRNGDEHIQHFPNPK
ncbi:MAG: DUF1398 family protein [Bdellovibrionales bacterium]|nr:DUF1398 family protein [Bdellovibrionales bacterium]